MENRSTSDDAADGFEILELVRAAGIELWVANGQLQFRAPSGALTTGIRSMLSDKKSRLIECLATPQYGRRQAVPRQRALHFYDGLWEKIRAGVLGVSFTNGTHWAAAVKGPLDVSALGRSVGRLVRRHPILAARVQERESLHFEFDHEVTLELVDLRGIADGSRRESEKDAALDALLWRSFAAEDALFRVFAVTLSQHEHVIGFVVNHYAADLASVHVIAGDLIAGYEPQAEAQAEEPALQYCDYVSTLNAWLETPALQYRLDFWRRSLSNAKASRLRPASHVEEERLGAQRYEPFRLEPGVLQRLQRLAASSGVTLFDTLLAAKACSLRFAVDEQDIAVLSMHHGRDDPILLGLVGSTQNQLVLRMRLDDEMTLSDLIRAVHTAASEAYRHQIPYHFVRGIFPSIGVSELLAEFNFVDFTSAAKGSPAGPFSRTLCSQAIRWPTARTAAAHSPSHFLKIEASPAGIRGGMGYLDILFSQPQIRAYLEDFKAAVGAIAQGPDLVLKDWGAARRAGATFG